MNFETLKIEGECDQVLLPTETRPAGSYCVQRMAWECESGLTLDGTRGATGFPVVLVYN